MSEVIRIEDKHYILATSSLADDRVRVLRSGETFAVLNRFGNIYAIGQGEQGLFHEGTRYLSRLRLRLAWGPWLLLSSSFETGHATGELAFDLTNPDVQLRNNVDFLHEKVVDLPHGSVHVYRSVAMKSGTLYERIRFDNYLNAPVNLEVWLEFEADFRDVFEIRGTQRLRRGERLEPEFGEREIRLGYVGLDRMQRRTRIVLSRTPDMVEHAQVGFRIRLDARGSETMFVWVACEQRDQRIELLGFEQVRRELVDTAHKVDEQACVIETSNPAFSEWLSRSLSDIRMMLTPGPLGCYPYAGIPWFNAPFGRDGIITAIETLWFDPSIASGVLTFLAAHQADAVDPESDAEPGKIVHEMRKGEMAACGEIPFGRYYGTVDATPLFVVLLWMYYERTGDRSMVEALWTNVERALLWMDCWGDPDGDGFVEYGRRSSRGLVHQGWKDSHDSVFHADDHLASGPIALCEVQGYVYAAKRAAARLAQLLGRTQQASALFEAADQLQKRFDAEFWSEQLGMYALALDGHKRACHVRTSNPGQCLFTGIALPERVPSLVSHLLADEMYSGWGIRTVASTEHRYNPMSYHNGSVWPHDNALIAFGMALHGYKQQTARVLGDMFEAASAIELHRLPELFCGFPRRPGQGPTLYPVACSPQTWAAGAVFLLLQAAMGLQIENGGTHVRFDRTVLLPSIHEIRLRNLRLQTGVVDVVIGRDSGGVGVRVANHVGKVDAMVTK